MKLIDIPQGSEEWQEEHKGKISGTMLSDLYSKRGGRKIGFYEILAQRLAIEPDDEDRMARGLRLEAEATRLFEEHSNKAVTHTGICVADVNSNIINSPDGLIADPLTLDLTGEVVEGTKYTAAIEIKCLSSARHLQAVVEGIPAEFEAQMYQYFIVNDDLQKLYFVFYDDRIKSIPLWIIPVTRESLGDKIEFFKNYQIEQLIELDALVERFAF